MDISALGQNSATSAVADGELTPPAVLVGEDSSSSRPVPTRVIDTVQLQQLGQNLDKTFRQYISDRRMAELKWMRNLRQYLGVYDPEIERDLSADRSKAYPRLTRVKCISVQARLMNLMFPGNERNWTLKASPSADLKPADIMAAIKRLQDKAATDGGPPLQLTPELVRSAVQTLADDKAGQLSIYLDDQLQELGGDQTCDYVQLNREVIRSGVIFGLGALEGPFVRTQTVTSWQFMNDLMGGSSLTPVEKVKYKPVYEFLKVWDFYPDMSAKTLNDMDGYFTRKVMTRAQVRKLANRPDFFEDQITTYLQRNQTGNYKAQPFETELRAMATRANVNDQKADQTKYEVIKWRGPISGTMLQAAGVTIPQDQLADDIDAEVWLVDGNVIKADMNPWRKLGVDLRTIHTFLFDQDDSSPVGTGLPDNMRDSQMAIAASTRMMLDNASVVCGPNLEINTDLLRSDQDVRSVSAYKMWYREGTGPEAQWPAVRNVEINSHVDELMKMIDMFSKFADVETFVGPQTGGDMSQGPSEPMRTAAGASMLRGDAALPFKDVVRSFDSFTQSVLQSMVMFNKKFNPDDFPDGDFNVIARGATSLVAKEIRGMQVDQLATSLTPGEIDHVDQRKLIEARFATRDLSDMLLPVEEVDRRQQVNAAKAEKDAELQQKLIEATVRKTLTDAFKNVTQGQKNAAAGDAATVNAALSILEQALGQDEQAGSGKVPSRASGRPARSGTK